MRQHIWNRGSVFIILLLSIYLAVNISRSAPILFSDCDVSFVIIFNYQTERKTEVLNMSQNGTMGSRKKFPEKYEYNFYSCWELLSDLLQIERKKLVIFKYIFILVGLFNLKENIFLKIYVQSTISEGCKPVAKRSPYKAWTNYAYLEQKSVLREKEEEEYRIWAFKDAWIND